MSLPLASPLVAEVRSLLAEGRTIIERIIASQEAEARRHDRLAAEARHHLRTLPHGHELRPQYMTIDACETMLAKTARAMAAHNRATITRTEAFLAAREAA